MATVAKARAKQAQPNQHLIIERQPDESLADWLRLLDDLVSYDKVIISSNSDGSVGLTWKHLEPAV